MLSVCIIARNEEKNLPRAIASVRGLADEVVVADTGSTDRTVEIARELGAVVCHFP
jgi:glycosyltransferase involved in cell wall biosynthesis